MSNLEVYNVEFGSVQCGIWKCAMSNLEVCNFEVNTALTGHHNMQYICQSAELQAGSAGTPEVAPFQF